MRSTWVGQDRWNLINLPLSELIKLYPEHTIGTLKGKKVYWSNKLTEGKIPMPPNPEQREVPQEYANRVADLLKRSGIEPDDIQHVTKTNVWQGFYKDAEGEAQTVDMVSVQYVPKPTELTEDDFIRQAKPTIIRPTKVRRRLSEEKTAIILPDIQAGFRRYEDGTLDPFHDENAISIALQIIRDVQPDQVVLNGDNLDLPQYGKYNQENSYAQTINPTLDYIHNLLANIRANAPNTKITYLGGNHEKRLSDYLMRYAREVHGIRRAATAERVLTVPFLLNLADVGVDYLSGYPANRYWLNERLAIIHGNVVRAAGQTAAAVVKKDEYSTIFGHVHRFEMAGRTAQNYSGARYIIAQSFGCLARIDGAVPSYGNGVDDYDQPIIRHENWQQGIGVVQYKEGDKPFTTHQVVIQTFDDYATQYNGKEYRPTE